MTEGNEAGVLDTLAEQWEEFAIREAKAAAISPATARCAARDVLAMLQIADALRARTQRPPLSDEGMQ